MTVGRKRKRYILLMSEGPIGLEDRKEIADLIVGRHPDLEKRLVWLERGLIVRTDVEHLAGMKVELALRVGSTKLETRSVSGSISKLKRMVSDGRS